MSTTTHDTDPTGPPRNTGQPGVSGSAGGSAGPTSYVDSQPERDDAMKAARPPVGTGTSPLFGLLLALVLIALGVVAVQEALTRSGAINGVSWTTWVLTRLDGVVSAPWMLIVFVLAALIGLLLLLIVFRPRPRKSLALKAQTGVYLRTGDLARIAESLVEGTDGVTDVSASSSLGRLKVKVTTVETKDRNSALGGVVRERLGPCLEPLQRAPKVSVDIRNEDLT